MKSFFIKGRPVVDATVKVADVDVVEMVGRPGPIKMDVINMKFTVRRYPPWLDRRDVGANDTGGWELICKITSGLVLV